MNKKEKKKEREKRERYKNPKLMYMFETLKSSRVFFFLLFFKHEGGKSRQKTNSFVSLSSTSSSLARGLQFGARETKDDDDAKGESREGKRDLFFVSVGVNSTRRDRAFASGGRRP